VRAAQRSGIDHGDVWDMARILAVDDSRSMRRMVGFTPRSGGFGVVEAMDGQDADEVAQQKSFEPVLADVNMPRRDGIEPIRRLRKLPRYESVPILTPTTESSAEKKALGWSGEP
jgi:two-component system chemotaxis response regulator CheY